MFFEAAKIGFVVVKVPSSTKIFCPEKNPVKRIFIPTGAKRQQLTFWYAFIILALVWL
jgi:hypothetical protein